MRALLIDPEQRTVTEMQIKGDDYRETNRILGCDMQTTGAYLNGSLEEGYDCIAVSDDELSEDNASRFWFQVDANRDPPSSFPIAGLGLAIGVDKEGEACDARISVSELVQRITFTRRKFKGFETKTSETAPHVSITAVAPIIDGANEEH